MKHLLTLISTFLFFSIVDGKEHFPIYEGTEIDLATYEISTLYKGREKQLLARDLDVGGIYNIVSKEKNLWHIALKFRTTQHTIDNRDIWIKFRTNINAASVYLNDRLLFRNGIVENLSQGKTSGYNLVMKRIPRNYLISGMNKVEVTFSNYKIQKGAIFRDLSLGNLYEFQNTTAIMSTAPILLFGIFLFAFFVNIGLYFSLNRKMTFIILALLFFVNCMLLGYEVLYWNGFLPSSSFINSYALRSNLEYLTYFILLIVLYFEYDFNQKHLVTCILTFVTSYFIADLVEISIAVALSFLPFIISLYALLKGVKNSLLITVSLLILFSFNYIDDNNLIEDFAFIRSNYIITSIVYKLDHLGMVLFALVMVFTSAKRILFKTKALHETRGKLERLKFQYLQKRMLPHFLMNSLMSLQQLISKDPTNASKMVEALSEEFHLLTLMNKKKKISIYQEIEICNTHLKIMSIQQKATYKMITKGIIGDEMIPPAIIHTLVENGITHGYFGNQDAYFELSKHKTPSGRIQYRLFNDSRIEKSEQKHSSGMGLKYIEARLEECYPENWKLSSNKVENGWESIIEFIDKE